MSIVAIKDFQGGYFTDISSELLNNNELLKAENCYCQDGIIKRNGISTYSTTDLSSFTGLKGATRAYINSTWYTIIALDDDSYVNFYYGTGTTFAAIDNDFDWTTGKDVEMAVLDGHVVCVNGTDKPAVIYYDGGFVIENLEAYDIRTRDEANWYAGQWDDSETETFIDDTTDAQDAGVDDFEIGSATNNDGCYISCDFTFNKIIFTGAEQAAGAPVAEYRYWSNTTGWTALTFVTTPVWTEVAGDRTMEFNLPLDSDGNLLWDQYTGDTDVLGIQNKFVIRIRFTTAATGAFSCDYLTLFNTQYLTLVLYNQRPHTVCTHNNQIYFAERNIVNFSPPHSVTGWREGQAEYFDEGGEKIMALVSHIDSLVVFKENTLYTFTTTNLLDPVRSRPQTSVGTIAPRSPKLIGNDICFVARDGIYKWDGGRAVKVSEHIKTDLESYTITNACGINYKNEYWVSFPSNSITLTFNPNTFREPEEGEGRVSFYKFTGYKANIFIYCNGASDTGYLLVGVDQSTPYLARCDNGATDNIGSITNIDMRVQTKYFSFTNYQTIKYLGRIKPEIKEVSAYSGRRHRIRFLNNNGTTTADIFVMVPKGNNYYSEDINIPYTIDGKNMSIEFKHNKNTSTTLRGYALNVEERRF